MKAFVQMLIFYSNPNADDAFNNYFMRLNDGRINLKAKGKCEIGAFL